MKKSVCVSGWTLGKLIFFEILSVPAFVFGLASSYEGTHDVTFGDGDTDNIKDVPPLYAGRITTQIIMIAIAVIEFGRHPGYAMFTSDCPPYAWPAIGLVILLLAYIFTLIFMIPFQIINVVGFCLAEVVRGRFTKSF